MEKIDKILSGLEKRQNELIKEADKIEAKLNNEDFTSLEKTVVLTNRLSFLRGMLEMSAEHIRAIEWIKNS